MAQIDRVKKGERPTLLEASKANQLIDAINALQNVTIEKADQDIVFVSSSGVKIYYKGGGDSDFNGSGVDGSMIAVGHDGKIGYEVGIEDGLVTSFSESPNGLTLGTGGRYQLLDATDHLVAKELFLENGFVKSVISKPSSFQGVSSWIELQDPTDISRTIRLLIRNGLIAQVESGISRYEFTPMEVCVDGVNETKNIITYNDNAQPQGLPGINDLLNEFYTKAESDAKFISINVGDGRYMGINDAYTKQEADRIFINGLNPPYYTKQESINRFLQINDANQDFAKKVDVAGDLNNLENNLEKEIQDAEDRVNLNLANNVQDLQQVDQQLQKNIDENKNLIDQAEEATELLDKRVVDLENKQDDFYTKSEVDQFVSDANEQIRQITSSIAQCNDAMSKIIGHINGIFEDSERREKILENIVNTLEN